MKELIRVVGAVAIDQRRVFMARRPASARHGGLWEFPGGKVEPGESDEGALARELLEELGVRSRVGELVAVGRDEHVALWCYRVEFMEPPQAHEHEAIAWVPLDQLTSLQVPPADVPAVEVLVSTLKIQ